MSWDKYTPIVDSSTFEFDEEIAVRAGDGLTVRTDDNKTSYLVVNVVPEDETALVYNYTTEEFETVSKEQILNWRQDNQTHSPMFTTHDLTVLESTDSADVVGVKIHGNGLQYPQTIDVHGRDAFVHCLRIAIRPGIHGREITEPYYPDESVIQPDFASFVQSVHDEFGPMLTDATALSESAVEELLDNILKGYEVAARGRVGLTTDWYYFDSTEDAKAQLEDVDTSPETLNTNTVKHGEYAEGDTVIFH